MPSLRDIIELLDNPSWSGSADVEIREVTHDSRKVGPGALFVAISGTNVDGHDYIPKALEAGATAILAESENTENIDIPWIQVSNSKHALGKAAAMVQGFPTTKFKLIGITGTNGKTTLTYLLESIIQAAGGAPAVVGTVSHRWSGMTQDAANTTPEASDLQSMFAKMAKDQVTHVFMEVSSHGLHRGRLEGCEFDMGVFTNLTQDHLDYHGTLEDYFAAKRILFDRFLASSLKPDPTAIINLDDDYGRRLFNEIATSNGIGYGASSDCDTRPIELSVSAKGITGKIISSGRTISIDSKLTGAFNVSNILAAVAVASRLQIATDAIEIGIRNLSGVPGRLERVPSSKATIFVDYAHTPHAVENVLSALNGIKKARIFTIIGCGGDRDRKKRPLMGSEAAAASDVIVITSDNPRSEDPSAIISEIEPGVIERGFSKFDSIADNPNTKSYVVIPDRREAIRWAIERVQSDDILLVAGKGHETYQEVKGRRWPFDDRLVIKEELKRLESEV